MSKWPTKKLKDVATIVNGATPSTKVAEYWGGQHQWVTPAEMGGRDSLIISSTRRTLTDAGLAACSAQMSPPGSVILSTRAPIGYLLINEVPMATNQGCRTIVPSPDLDATFLLLVLRSRVEELQELGTGATFSELSAGKLSNFEIQLPPINEQRKIVERYEKVEELQKSISLLNQERYFGVRSFFHSLRRTLLSAASLSAPLVALGDLCEILDSKRVPITKKDRVPGPYPYYGATGIVDYVANYIFDEALVLVGEDGAKWGADEGSAFLVEGKSWVNNHAHVLRPIASRVCQDWVVQCLNSMDLTEFVGGLTVPKLNQSALRKIVIPVPPIGVQEAILKKINAVSLVLEDVRPSSQNLQTSVSELGRTFLLDELEAA